MLFQPEKILVFDIYADYAQFKKYFTNMSPLTFSMPPRTVLCGVLGGLIGIDKSDNPEKFSKENSFVSVKTNNPIKKVKVPTNYLKTTSEKHFSKFEQHKPTNVEYLKKPSFRVFAAHKDKNINQKIRQNLSEHKSVYTLNLGISSCIANFSFVGEFDVKLAKGEADFISVVSKDMIKNIVFKDDVILQQCTLPNFMKNDREVLEYREFLYEVNGNKISGEVDSYLKILSTGDNIVGM
ncbi:MAG: type I-B CRISPR-associated protein Cas5 [Desulfamplus sp.]|nr:type I-B CRISPR-associated protein Cas5 [Desulfamplus sp.]